MRLYGFGNINIGDGVLNNRESPGNVQGSPIAANWLLGVDTSTDQTGIAVTDGTDLLDVSLPGGRQQTRDLLPAIDWLLTQHGLTLGQIGAAAVTIGPGSFTGLRVGLSVAKGLALAQGAAVIGIPTLEIVSWPYRASATPVLAVLPAGRSRFVWAVAEPGVAIAAPVNSSLDELVEAAHARPDLLVAGELPPPAYEALVAAGVRLESRLLGSRRAAALVDLGWRRWAAGEVNDASSLEPIYLHGKQTALPPRSQR
jgi:tRNA threonylcarbamoyladenosine biosynthesis protein TsaB